MLLVQKHLQFVTKALTGKEVVPIGELLDKIKQLQAENERLKDQVAYWQKALREKGVEIVDKSKP